MEIKNLKNRQNFNQSKTGDLYSQFAQLLEELRKKNLPEGTIGSINKEIDNINTISELEKELSKQLILTRSRILKLVEKEVGLVSINHNRNTWFAVGAVFGLLFGVALGASLGNMAFLALGTPIGMALGLTVGMGMDKKALEEGKQIAFEIKY